MSKSYRILILDDDQHLGEMLRIFLETTVPCVVEWIDSVDIFWNRVDVNPYDILFLDYKLPGTTGLEIIEEMSRRRITVPVVMMTGEGSEQVAVHAIQAGAVDYLVKGNFQLNHLPGLVQKAVQMHELQLAVEQSLEENQYQAMLLNNIREAVVVWDLGGTITFWNPAAYLLFGWSANERLGQSVYDMYLSAFTPPVIVPGARDTAGFEVERQYRTKKGEIIWISSRTTALREASGERKIIGYMDVSRNITRSKQEQQALKESQHFVQRIVDTTPNILYIYDLVESRYKYTNKVVASIIGYTSEQMQEMEDPLREIIHPQDYERVNEHYQRFSDVSDSRVLEIEYRVKATDRSWHWLHSRDTVFQRLPDGSPRQVIGIAEDITARKEAEDALRRRLEIEQLIASISTNLVNLMSGEMDLGIEDGLEACSEFTGIDHSYIVLFDRVQQTARITHAWSVEPKTAETLLHNEHRLQLFDWVLPKLSGFENIHIPHIADLPPEASGLTQWLQSRGVHSVILIPMHYKGVLQGMLGFDTTKQEKRWEEEDIRMLRTIGDIFVNALVHKWAEEALQKSEARYRAIVDDHQTDLICRFLSDGTITFVNEAYYRFYGKTRGELVGSSVLAFVPEMDREPVGQRFRSLTIANPVETYEHRIITPAGEVRWFERTDRAIFDEGGHFTEIQSVGRDITERKEMEKQIQTVQNQMAQQSRLAAIGELAASVAHLINNPLTTIIGEAQILLQDASADGTVQESVEAIEKAGWRAQKVVQQLMEFSQPNADTLEQLSINETIERALVMVGAHIESAGVSLVRELDADLPTVRGNARQFEDLWVNLFLRAREATADGQSHTIRVTSKADQNGKVQVEVWDDGKAIPEDELDTIFEPSLTPQCGGRGSGMELSICREIVRQNRGVIRAVHSDRGTAFQIEFPREV